MILSIESTKQYLCIIGTFDLSQSPVYKVQRLIGNHTDLIDNNCVDTIPGSHEVSQHSMADTLCYDCVQQASLMPDE